MTWDRVGRLFVANSGSNSVSVIENGKVTETIKTSLDPKALVGSTPDALALSRDGKRLYVANADNNDVAVIDICRERRFQDARLHPDRLVPDRPGHLARRSQALRRHRQGAWL